ncbi:MAG: cation:proton antiporter [Polynucleobacter sp.]|nr:cation:proton antiporter [Polynucleobacter sp.]MDZ4057856.1 cation:proton antiporter [Polynucleobacter sp.]
MPHDVSLIAILAVGFGLALILGLGVSYLKMPPLVGYLLAGVMIGPATPGFVADVSLSAQLAEIGVMLLMFGVGLHFSINDLLSVKKIAIPGALFQMTVATALGFAVAHYWGWSVLGSLIFGLSLSVASTVVLLRALESKGLIETVNGKIAVGWLVVEDLVMVLALVLLPVMAGIFETTQVGTGEAEKNWSDLMQAVGITLAKVTAFIVLMLVVGKRLLPKLLWLVAKNGSRELFTLAVIASAIGIAFLAASLFDVSFALGAFFAGMMLGESELSKRAADESLPLRDAFAVLFFVSVGMLFNPEILWNEPLKLLTVILIIVIGKTIAAVGLVLLFKYPLSTAMTVGVSLAQIGEFSFILAGMGLAMGLITSEAYSLILAGAIISIAMNSFLFNGIEPLLEWVRKRSPLARKLDQRIDPLALLPTTVNQSLLTGQVVIVGHGRVGKKVFEMLKAKNVSCVIAEKDRAVVQELRENDIPAVSGDASDPFVLIQAHIARASVLVIATQDSIDVSKMVETARALNPGVTIFIRARDSEEIALYEKEGWGKSFTPEHELAQRLANEVLLRLQEGAKGVH